MTRRGRPGRCGAPASNREDEAMAERQNAALEAHRERIAAAIGAGNQRARAEGGDQVGG